LYKKLLGLTSETIPVVGQGTGIVGSPTGNSRFVGMGTVLCRGIELGMTLIDTAPVYGDGVAEEAVGKAAHGIRASVFIATKVASEDLHADGVKRSLDASLRRLGTEYVDLLQIHWSNPNVPIAETMGAMSELVTEGKVRHIGVSNFSLKELDDAKNALAPLPLASIQLEYNLYERSIEESILPYCVEHGISVIAYSPLAGGKIVSSEIQKAALVEISRKYGRTVSQVVLRWLVSNGPVVVIPNTTKYERLDENAGAADFDLLEDDIAEINRICAVRRMSVPTDSIRISTNTGRAVYQTVQEAIENRLKMVPSPLELAEEMRSGIFLKPVRLVRSTSNDHAFDLIEGRLRYWGWVIAHDGKLPIPAIIEDAWR
jgi:diketogulonate reductase-like aldo/keto reductase